jgi:hypothetical protein
MKKPSIFEKLAKNPARTLIPALFGLIVGVFLVQAAMLGSTGRFDYLFDEHPAAMLGLPLIAIGALCLVLILRGTSGPIELEVLGLKFKGAAGPIIMWVLTFLAMALAVKLLW